MAKAKSSDLIALLEPYFTKQAPFQIPAKWRELIVEGMPWVNVIIILLIPLALVALGVDGFVSVVVTSIGVTQGPLVVIFGLVLMASIALLFATFPGLRARMLLAWKLVFWAGIIFFVYGILRALESGSFFDIIIQAISTIIGLYVLFQIKSYYK